MTFLLVAALLVVAIAAVLIGAVSASTPAFVVGAVCSGIAIVLLWRETNARRENTFVTNPPQRSVPEWSQPQETRIDLNAPASEPPIELAIDGYDDLLAAEILPSLETLSIDELEAIIKRERSGLARVSVINRAQVLIDLTKGPEVAPQSSAAPRSQPGRGGSIEIEDEGRPSSKPRQPRKTAQRATPTQRSSQSKSAEQQGPQKGPKTPRKNTQRKGPDLSI